MSHAIVRQLGLLKYDDCLKIMDECHAEVVAHIESPGYLLCVEHPKVVTMGNRDTTSDITATNLFNLGIDFAKIDRGGSVTAHEPGQIVIYPILRLGTSHHTPQDHSSSPTAPRLSVKNFVWILEEAMIRMCEIYGVVATRDSAYPGVWVGQSKIGALGIRVKNLVSKHGLAFNFTNTLETFRVLTPCGIRDRGVTSLQREANTHLPNFSVASSQLIEILLVLLKENSQKQQE